MTTLTDALTAWAKDAERRGLAPRYIEQQRARIAHLESMVGSRHPTPADIADWLDALRTTGMPRSNGPSKPCTAKTLNNHLAALRVFVRWAIRNGHLPDDPTTGVEWARTTRAKGRTLSAQQAWALFEAARQDERAQVPRCRERSGRPVRRAGFYRLLISTGMRAGAAESLRVRDFELNADPPRIVVRAEADKSRKERSLVISEADRAWFEAELAGRGPNERAFKRPHHKVVNSDARAAGVPVKDERGRGVGFHCFRRWYGSEMDRQGFSIEQIRDRLGHTCITMTQRYLVRELEEQQGVAEQMTRVVQKNHEISVDTGGKIADALVAKNDTHSTTDHAVHRGERSAPVVLRSRTAPTPRDPAFPPGHPPGRHENRGPQARFSDPESGRQDLNLRPCGPKPHALPS